MAARALTRSKLQMRNMRNAAPQGCLNPHKCKEAGKKTIDSESIENSWIPIPTQLRAVAYVRERNEYVQELPEAQKIEDGFRVFHEKEINNDIPNPREQDNAQEPHRGDNGEEINVFLSGLVVNRNLQNQAAYIAVYYGAMRENNEVLRAYGIEQTSLGAEVTGMIHVLNTAPPETSIRFHFRTKAVPNLLLNKQGIQEDQGWMTHHNKEVLQILINRLRTHPRKILLEASESGETAQRLTEAHLMVTDRCERRINEQPEPHSIPPPDRTDTTSMGAKLMAMTQSSLYRGIRTIQKRPNERRTATALVDVTRHAVQEITGELPNDEAIWASLRNKIHSHRHRAFLWRAMQNSYKIGYYWDNIPTMEHRGMCRECGVPETLEHIMTTCQVSGQEPIWREAERVWNLRHRAPEWHKPTLGTILGSGLVKLKDEQGRILPGASRLYTILVSESAHHIWRARCKWRITNHSDPLKRETPETHISTWTKILNRRLQLEVLQTNTYKYGKKALSATLVDKTWRGVLKNSEHVQDDWISTMGGLVGIG